MRGRPIFEWLAFMSLWLLLLVPLRMLTFRESVPVAEVSEVSESARREVWAVIRFSERPVRFRLTQESRTLWEEERVAENTVARGFSLELYGKSADILIEVWWGLSDELKAVELVLEPDEWVEQSRTIWERSDILEETVTFQW